MIVNSPWYLKPLGAQVDLRAVRVALRPAARPYRQESARASAAAYFLQGLPALGSIFGGAYSTSPGALPPGRYCAAI